VADSEAVEQAARELYGLPPGEFTRARDARVKELRKGGDREAADAVKALRKPTVAAWALNQLARSRAKDVERLLAAGEDLRGAQEELLGGGDRAAFQEAAAVERELVAELSADATTLASEAGERGGGLREKVAETLHAAALDEDTAADLRAGRLTREREAIGGFGAPGGALVAAPAERPRKEKAKRSSARPAAAKPSAPKGGKRARAGDARADAERARREDAECRQRLAAARTDERHARRELEAAEKAVRHSQERADAARVHAEEAAQRAKTTAERLKEAKKAETAARRAHTRAERALDSAEPSP
jgi:hypothetical protein